MKKKQLGLYRRMGLYEKYLKRLLDIACSVLTIIAFSWLYLILAILVKIRLGSPILFIQPRPGLVDSKTGKESIFNMYKFRTMLDKKDDEGNLLPDELRLTKFGAWLRSTSLDELPEVFNILKGEMSIIGPRPQLVRDMVFMTDEQRMRHFVKPGLSGLAQVNGRNAITWEKKLSIDQEYIRDISFLKDIKILLQTLEKAFVKKEGITGDNMATAEDLGDFLFRTGKIDSEAYKLKQAEAYSILKEFDLVNKK